MKSAYITHYGSVDDVVELGDVPKPELQPDEVLIEAHSAGVNPIDWKIIEGVMSSGKPLTGPRRIGYDVSGVVAEIGSAVTRFRPGDEVFCRVDSAHPGAFAEYVAVIEGLVAPKPKNIDFTEAAAVPLASMTAWQALFEHIQLKSGQKVLIHAGVGGVGSFAIQFAQHAGAQVATTVGPQSVERAKALGATWVIDYQHERFEKRLHDFDAVFDTIGGETQRRSLAVLKPGGVLVSTVGISVPDTPGIRLIPMIMHAEESQLEEIAKLIESGEVRPVIDRVFSLDQIKEALLYSRSGHAHGKIVVRVR